MQRVLPAQHHAYTSVHVGPTVEARCAQPGQHEQHNCFSNSPRHLPLLSATSANVNFLIVGTVRGRRFKACSRCDMLSMADAQAVKPLSKTRWFRRAQCGGKLLVLDLWTQCRSFIDLVGDKIYQFHSAKSMLLPHMTYRLRSDTVDMSLTEQNASKQLQQCASKSDGKLSGWVVKTGG